MGGGRSLCAGGLRSGAGDHPPDYLQPQQCIPDPPTPDPNPLSISTLATPTPSIEEYPLSLPY